MEFLSSRRFRHSVAAWCLGLCAIPLAAKTFLDEAGESNSTCRLELRCKIIPAPAERGYQLWRVELKRATGVVVKRAQAGTGDTVHFKDFPPGIYLVCLAGEKGRAGCKSVDLVPPPDQSTFQFSGFINTPPTELTNKAKHSVSASRLAVPVQARKEMLASEAAQERGDSAKSMKHLERAVEIYPSYADALNNLGTHYHRSGNYERSIGLFAHATQADPTFFAGWLNLAGSLISAGQFVEAIEPNRRALELKPDDPLVNSQTGLNYFYMRRYSEAQRYFLKAAEVDPSSANSPHLFLAHIAVAEHQPEEAERYIESFLKLHPNAPQAVGLQQTLRSLAVSSNVVENQLIKP